MSFLRNALRLSRLIADFFDDFLYRLCFARHTQNIYFRFFLLPFPYVNFSEFLWQKILTFCEILSGPLLCSVLALFILSFVAHTRQNSFSARYFQARAKVNLLCTSNFLSLHTEQQNFKERRKTFCFRLNYPTPLP